MITTPGFFSIPPNPPDRMQAMSQDALDALRRQLAIYSRLVPSNSESGSSRLLKCARCLADDAGRAAGSNRHEQAIALVHRGYEALPMSLASLGGGK